MEWVPVVLITFKLGVLFTGMCYAIKWHYEQGKKARKGGPRGFLAEIEQEQAADREG